MRLIIGCGVPGETPEDLRNMRIPCKPEHTLAGTEGQRSRPGPNVDELKDNAELLGEPREGQPDIVR